MDVGATRQGGGVDLRDRSNHDHLPVRPGSRHGIDQRKIDALVDDAVKAQLRAGNRGLVKRFGDTAARRREMIAVDRRGEGVDRVVAVTLRFVQAVAPREHDVRPLDQRGLALDQQRVGECERGEFVHAVVYDGFRAEMIGEAQHHRRVEP